MEKDLPKLTHLKWYFRSYFLVSVFLLAGPLVLPLIWLHPTFSKTKKITLTIVIVIVSYVMGIAFLKSLESIQTYYSVIDGF